jgi:hypothetical protein
MNPLDAVRHDASGTVTVTTLATLQGASDARPIRARQMHNVTGDPEYGAPMNHSDLRWAIGVDQDPPPVRESYRACDIVLNTKGVGQCLRASRTF